MTTAKEDMVNAVLAALAVDHDINLHAYPIRVRFDGALRLEGQVENIVAKRKARRIALQISALSGIEDHLRLYPSEHRDGKALQDAIVEALAMEPAFRDIRVYASPAAPADVQWIAVGVEAGDVQLHGQVGSLSHRRLAEVIAWWVPGSCNIHNHLRVQPAETDTDDEISDAIRLVLEKDPLLHAENIRAATAQRTVTLHGYVHDEHQRRMAVYDCWYVPGVHAVHDQLRVLQ
ncbi:MAG: BON domain-containing protein [Gammaproteobacteria bacterium]|nr:BON domain-containing protein [Gammaproteobacteria bacterium]